jgi:ABC-2 type transport system permease protein
MESAMIQGLLAQQIMQSVGREAFQGSLGRENLKEYRASQEQGGGPAGEEGRLLRSMLQQIDAWQEMHASDTLEKKTGEGFSAGLSIPYTIQEEEVTAGTGIRYNAFAQAFAGMGVQFILFASINEGVAILEERRKGIWKRLRCALVTSACGLFLAAIGGNPMTTRVVAIAALLFLLMLGGAWIPYFLFPAWLQKLSLWNPIYWAMQGFSGVTWRGQDFQAVLPAMAVVFGFAILFAALALWRFRWEE